MKLEAWGYTPNHLGGLDCTADMCFGRQDREGHLISPHKDGCPTAAHERIVETAAEFIRIAGELGG